MKDKEMPSFNKKITLSTKLPTETTSKWKPVAGSSFQGAKGHVKDDESGRSDDGEDYTVPMREASKSGFKKKVVERDEIQGLTDDVKRLSLDNKVNQALSDLTKEVSNIAKSNGNAINALTKAITALANAKNNKNDDVLKELLSKMCDGIDAALEPVRKAETLEDLIKSWDSSFEEDKDIIILAGKGVENIDPNDIGAYRRFYGIEELLARSEGPRLEVNEPEESNNNVDEAE